MQGQVARACQRMPLPGGPSDKIGNRYERRWTVRALIELLQGTATSVLIEVPGPEGTATEFRRTDNDGHTWHQAKRQNTAGSWTIATLTGPGVIDAMWTKGSVGERFTFVSSIGVTFLTELTERAGQARDYDDFNTNFISDEGHKNAFQKLRDQWKATSEQAYNALQLIKVVVIDEERLQTWNVDALRPWVDNPESAADILGQLVDDSVHKELTKDDVWERLTDRGITPAVFTTDPDLAARIDKTATTRLALLRLKLVNGAQIERTETAAAIAALEDHPSVAILGAAGSGKSVVLASLIDWSRNEGRPTLVISADRLPAALTVPALGAELGLGTSPVAALAAAARGKLATLVIDQLDAVSVISGRNPGGTELIDSLLTEARSHPSIKVIVACRQFDLDNDTGLRNVAIKDDTQRITVPVLTEDQVRDAIALAGLPAVSSARLLLLLQLPITLAIYIEVSKAGQSDLTGAKTLTDLYNAYWADKQRVCPPPDAWTAVMDVLVDSMATNKSLDRARRRPRWARRPARQDDLRRCTCRRREPHRVLPRDVLRLRVRPTVRRPPPDHPRRPRRPGPVLPGTRPTGPRVRTIHRRAQLPKRPELAPAHRRGPAAPQSTRPRTVRDDQRTDRR